MAKLPYMKFYVGDWRRNANLRRCSHVARGMWIDMMCLAFDCDEPGVLATAGKPWTDHEIAEAVGGDVQAGLIGIRELVEKGVANRTESGAICSRRMHRDGLIRKARSKAGALGAESRWQNDSKPHGKGHGKTVISDLCSEVCISDILEDELTARERPREHCVPAESEPFGDAAMSEVRRYFAAKDKGITAIDSHRYVAAQVVIDDYGFEFLKEAVSWAITQRPIAGFRMMLSRARRRGGIAGCESAPGFKTAQQSEADEQAALRAKVGF